MHSTAAGPKNTVQQTWILFFRKMTYFSRFWLTSCHCFSSGIRVKSDLGPLLFCGPKYVKN